MKKKLLILLLIPALLITLTACDKKGKDTKKENNVKTITLKDEKIGYKTTFSYDKKENYSEVKEESGASKEISFDNEDKDVSFQMYYNKISDNSYETSKNNRSEQKYYKEYKFGKYEAYAYSEYDDGLYVIIKLAEEDNMDILLFVSIDRIDNNKDIIVKDVFEKDLNKFFNTIKIEKIK